MITDRLFGEDNLGIRKYNCRHWSRYTFLNGGEYKEEPLSDNSQVFEMHKGGVFCNTWIESYKKGSGDIMLKS